MQNVYSIIRGELEQLLISVYPKVKCDIDLECAAAEASAPLGYASGLDASVCAHALFADAKRNMPLLFGAPLVKAVFPSGGHVCFSITAEAYAAAVAHIIKSYPLPGIPEDTAEDAAYAAARMLMLARGAGRGCPDIQSVRRALWLALGIEGSCGKKREAMRKRAASALLCMMNGMNAAQRSALRPMLGEVGACAARLLCMPAGPNQP